MTRGNLSDYETGRKSPTVATLARILAGAGLQIRAELEPLRADLEARVDAVEATPDPLPPELVEGLAAVLAPLPLAWGLDGETALRAHGLGFRVEVPQLALLWDDEARQWFFRNGVRGTGGAPVSWFEQDLGALQAYLGRMALGPFGAAQVRLLPETPPTVRVEVAPGLVVPVLTVAEVERGWSDLAEVLARLRRRGRAGEAHVA